MGFKGCRDFKVSKALEDFPPSKKNRDGRNSYCRLCMTVRSRESYRLRREAQGRTVREKEDLSAGFRRCPDCRVIKPSGDFSRNRAAKGGRAAYCKSCANVRSRESRVRLHGSTRHYHLVRRYGITAAEFDAMVLAQGGLCPLCRERTPVHVDHDHLTGAVRGVLCSCCNQGLGNFRDNTDTLRAAIDYLERTTWQRTQVCTGVYRLTSPRLAARRSASSSALQHLISSRGAGSSPPE